jgi:hypothetical protein
MYKNGKLTPDVNENRKIIFFFRFTKFGMYTHDRQQKEFLSKRTSPESNKAKSL